jgi:hypothetical protein
MLLLTGNGAGLGQVREKELVAAARVLKVQSTPVNGDKLCSNVSAMLTVSHSRLGLRQVDISNVTVMDEPQLQVCAVSLLPSLGLISVWPPEHWLHHHACMQHLCS